ncbi:MAG: YgiT-type zinc finger protein [Candidatus Nanohaloarchaea archaeon]|nr:YgiT-type zinc finger protein [Candidatus Nanohaloarchaea archaeon]
MAEEECALCGGEMVEEDLEDEREQKIRRNSEIEDEEDMHALVCQDCGHVAYRRS